MQMDADDFFAGYESEIEDMEYVLSQAAAFRLPSVCCEALRFRIRSMLQAMESWSHPPISPVQERWVFGDHGGREVGFHTILRDGS